MKQAVVADKSEKKPITKSFGEMMRFIVVGVAATAIHYVIYYVLLRVVSHNVAYTVGYVVSFLCNYVMSSRYTFRVSYSVKRLVGFSLSHIANYLIGLGLLNLFIWMGVSKEMAPVPTIIIAVPINFLLVRRALTFKENK